MLHFDKESAHVCCVQCGRRALAHITQFICVRRHLFCLHGQANEHLRISFQGGFIFQFILCASAIEIPTQSERLKGLNFYLSDFFVTERCIEKV